MTYTYLKLDIEEKVATVTLHRPDKGNALSPDVLMEVERMFKELSDREDVNVVVLTGGEKYFSAGFDLNVIRTLEKVNNEEFTAVGFAVGNKLGVVLYDWCRWSNRICRNDIDLRLAHRLSRSHITVPYNSFLWRNTICH